MSNITVYKFVQKFRQTSKQLLRKRQKTLGGYFFATPCRWHVIVMWRVTYSVDNQLRYAKTQLDRLKKTNVFNTTFHIWSVFSENWYTFHTLLIIGQGAGGGCQKRFLSVCLFVCLHFYSPPARVEVNVADLPLLGRDSSPPLAFVSV